MKKRPDDVHVVLKYVRVGLEYRQMQIFHHSSRGVRSQIVDFAFLIKSFWDCCRIIYKQLLNSNKDG